MVHSISVHQPTYLMKTYRYKHTAAGSSVDFHTKCRGLLGGLLVFSFFWFGKLKDTFFNTQRGK